MDKPQLILEVIKTAASTATPIIVAYLGVMLLRRIETIKAVVAKESDFQKKWAEQFFTCGQTFLQTLEQELAILVVTNSNNADNSKTATEISRLNLELSELELRIRRNVVFAPKTGGEVVISAGQCLQQLHSLLESGRGNLDDLISTMNKFNLASRRSHAEMLLLKLE